MITDAVAGRLEIKLKLTKSNRNAATGVEEDIPQLEFVAAKTYLHMAMN